MKGIKEVATAVMKIPGMSRTGRAEQLRRGVGRLEGVLDVEINYILDSVTVKYDASKLTPTQVKEALKSSGRGKGRVGRL
ncbi:MAG: heavy-metal-associated domain-containing protein [Nitrososphaerota archaeon]|nr:heavy-metal-associated domain-containing protein [Nitrososphaerota archaeon]MDG6989988.1 heavy-metal-associated domain-containing protein [Nitrososphaerota archaeon]